MGLGHGVVTAVVRVQSRAWQLPHTIKKPQENKVLSHKENLASLVNSTKYLSKEKIPVPHKLFRELKRKKRFPTHFKTLFIYLLATPLAGGSSQARV